MRFSVYIRFLAPLRNHPKAVIAVGFTAYIILFIAAFNPIGNAVIGLAFIPLLLIAYDYGLRGAVVGGIVTLVINLGLLMVLNTGESLSIGTWVGLLTIFAVGLVMGYVSDKDSLLNEEIAKRQKIERDLRASLKEERSLKNFREQVTSMISHDLRNPLSVISLSTEMLLNYTDRMTPERQRERLWQIQAQVERLESLLDDLLIIGKAQAVQQHLHLSTVDLVAFCTEIVEEMQEMDDGKHDITFSHDHLPITAQVDPRLMQRVFQNVLTNALKYSSERKPIEVCLTRQGPAAEFSVKDEGIGISEEDLPNLFQMFSRASNVGDIPGTGLGLVIVKEIVELHKGQVQVKSVLNEGTTFTITLPLTSTQPASPEQVLPKVQSPSETG